MGTSPSFCQLATGSVLRDHLTEIGCPATAIVMATS